MAFIGEADDVLAFFREANAEKLLCVFNFAREDRRWTLPPGTLIFEELDIPERKATLEGLAITLQPLGCFVGRVL
jgi:alpha-glucosidase